MRTSVDVVEVAPRDGLQNEAEVLSTADKLQLVGVLASAGLRRIEVTSFVNPAKVPALADAEQVCQALPRVPGLAWSALVLNDRGLERALAAGMDEVDIVVVATDTFSLRNQGVDTSAGTATWRRLAARARSAGVRTTLTVAAAFGCPFEGRVSSQRVADVVEACWAEPGDELALADTIGVGTPGQVVELAGVAARLVPGSALRWHFHNTRNTGYANAWTAVLASPADVPLALDASAGGIGGCPFAPRATGNIATEDLVEMLEGSGVGTGVDIEPMLPLADWLEKRLGHPVAGQLARAGRFPAHLPR